MSSLYKNGDTYYIAVSFEGKRVTRSLATKDYNIARKLKPHMELKLLKELHGFELKQNEMPFSKLVKLYICLLYTSPSPRDLSTSRMPSSA